MKAPESRKRACPIFLNLSSRRRSQEKGPASDWRRYMERGSRAVVIFGFTVRSTKEQHSKFISPNLRKIRNLHEASLRGIMRSDCAPTPSRCTWRRPLAQLIAPQSGPSPIAPSLYRRILLLLLLVNQHRV